MNHKKSFSAYLEQDELSPGWCEGVVAQRDKCVHMLELIQQYLNMNLNFRTKNKESDLM